jgi:hypothetical protein
MLLRWLPLKIKILWDDLAQDCIERFGRSIPQQCGVESVPQDLSDSFRLGFHDGRLSKL